MRTQGRCRIGCELALELLHADAVGCPHAVGIDGVQQRKHHLVGKQRVHQRHLQPRAHGGKHLDDALGRSVGQYGLAGKATPLQGARTLCNLRREVAPQDGPQRLSPVVIHERRPLGRIGGHAVHQVRKVFEAIHGNGRLLAGGRCVFWGAAHDRRCRAGGRNVLARSFDSPLRSG